MTRVAATRPRAGKLLANAIGIVALTAVGVVPAAHASTSPAFPVAQAEATADCPRGWDLVDPVTKRLWFELTLMQARPSDGFRGVNLQFDQTTRNAWAAGDLSYEAADRWGLAPGFGYSLPYLTFAGDEVGLHNVRGELSRTSGEIDGRAYAYTISTDDGHTVYFDDRGQAIVDRGPQGGALRLYYASGEQLPPDTTRSFLQRMVTPAGQPVLVRNDGERVWFVDDTDGDPIADLSVIGSPTSHIWSAEAGDVGDVFLNWRYLDERDQIAEFVCRRNDLSVLTTTFTYAPADRGRTVEDVAVKDGWPIVPAAGE